MMTINCKGSLIDLTTPKVMGILNITPDSFFDGGKYKNETDILNQTEKMHQKELGERMFLTPSTITRFLEKLDAKGLVTKTSEGKNVYVSSTVKGKALQAEIVAAWNELHTIYDGILSEEETREFVNISNKLIDKLGQ